MKPRMIAGHVLNDCGQVLLITYVLQSSKKKYTVTYLQCPGDGSDGNIF